MGNCIGKKEPNASVLLAAAARSSQADLTSDNGYATLPLVGLQTKQSLAASKTNVYSPNDQVQGHVRVFVALCDYDTRTSEDLTFKKGDYLEVMVENSVSDWCRGKSQSTQEEGYFPGNYVAEANTLEAEE